MSAVARWEAKAGTGSSGGGGGGGGEYLGGRPRRFVVEARMLWGVTYWDTVKVLLANTLGLSLALLEGVLVLELGSHFGGSR